MGFTMDHLRARLGKRSYCIAIRGQEPLWKRIQIIFFLTLRSVHTSRQVAETCCGDRSPRVCTGPATSCSNMLRRHIAATNRSVCTGEFLWKSFSLQQNFVAATCCKKSNRTEFVRLIAATKFCCRDKDFHKFLQYTRSDVSPQRVAATSRRTCAHGVISRRDLLLQLVA